MVADIKKIEIEINALTETLSSLEQEYERGEIDIGRYLKMQRNYLEQKGLAIENLNDILREKGAGALADVVAELPTSRDDRGLRTDLERVAIEGESKGWGTIVLHEFNPFLKSDVSGLNDAEKAILCFMINKEENDLPAFDIITGAKEFSARPIPTQDTLEVMTSLNILRHKNDNYYLANPIFRRWLIRCTNNPFTKKGEEDDVLRKENMEGSK